MKTSLKNASEEKVEEIDEAAVAIIEGTEESLPAVQSSALAIGQVSGEVAATDLIIPRLNIVQSVGPLTENFAGGDVILNKETVLAAKEAPLKLVVLSITKTYQEWLDYDPNGPRPQTFQSIQEVVDAGMWIDWRNDQRPPAREIATMLLFIEEPDGAESMSFNHEVEGKNYALALWTVHGTAYTNAAKKVFSANQLELKEAGLITGEWTLHTERKSVNNNFVFVPVMRLTDTASEGLVEYVSTKL